MKKNLDWIRAIAKLPAQEQGKLLREMSIPTKNLAAVAQTRREIEGPQDAKDKGFLDMDLLKEFGFVRGRVILCVSGHEVLRAPTG